MLSDKISSRDTNLIKTFEIDFPENKVNIEYMERFANVVNNFTKIPGSQDSLLNLTVEQNKKLTQNSEVPTYSIRANSGILDYEEMEHLLNKVTGGNLRGIKHFPQTEGDDRVLVKNLGKEQLSVRMEMVEYPKKALEQALNDIQEYRSIKEQQLEKAHISAQAGSIEIKAIIAMRSNSTEIIK